MHRICTMFVILLAWIMTPLIAIAATESDVEAARWQALHQQLFSGRPIADGSGIVALDAPYRAHDAAIVPIRVRALFAQAPERFIESITLVIDMNPMPMAGRFHFTSASGIADIETRVRVNSYTTVRAVAQTNDGRLYMTTRYVKASGGCSAPAAKDPDQAMARLGKMKLRQSPAPQWGQPTRAQLLISHPNNTGMQMDQLTRHYVPEHFISELTISYRGQPVLRAESGISLSEDPSIHFHFVPDQPGALSVEVKDSKRGVFTSSWDVAGGES